MSHEDLLSYSSSSSTSTIKSETINKNNNNNGNINNRSNSRLSNNNSNNNSRAQSRLSNASNDKSKNNSVMSVKSRSNSQMSNVSKAKSTSNLSTLSETVRSNDDDEDEENVDEYKVSGLTKEEKNAILGVLARNEEMWKKEKERIRLVHREMMELRAHGLQNYSLDANLMCSRCQCYFGWFHNKGVTCVNCQQKVCVRCRELLPNKQFLCSLCSRIMDLEKRAGEWFYKGKRSKDEVDVAETLLQLKNSLLDKSLLENVKVEEGVDQDDVDKPVRLKLTKKNYFSSKENETSASNKVKQSRRQNVVALDFAEVFGGGGGGDATSPGGYYPSEESDADSDDGADVGDGDFSGGLEDNESNGRLMSGDGRGVVSGDEGERGFSGFPRGLASKIPHKEEKEKKSALVKSKKKGLTGSLESLGTIYSGAGEVHYGKVMVSGEIEISARFEKFVAKLYVTVHQCKDLGIVDFAKKTSNPYVKLYLLPDKSRKSKRKTKVKKNTLNPVFDEIIDYDVDTMFSLEKRRLHLSVWHSGSFGKNDFLGEVEIPFNNEEMEQLEEGCWFKLNNRRQQLISKLNYYGHLDLSLQFVSKESLDKHVKGHEGDGELLILLKQARNLSKDKGEKLNHSYCQVVLFQGLKKLVRHKSHMIKQKDKKLLVWNQTFVFPKVSRKSLLDCSLEFTFWDKETFNNSDFLGGVRLNMGTGKIAGKGKVDWMDARGDEVILWQSILDRPDSWVDGSLQLRSSMVSRKS